MTIETCYQLLGGDYQGVRARIPSDALIRKFLKLFLSDPSFQALCSAMEKGDRATAFRQAHTLKGLCANLGFDRLGRSASALTEVLRPEADTIPAGAFALLDTVQEDHRAAVDAITALTAEA